MFLRKSSNQSLFHISMGRFVCVSVYFSVHNSFVSLDVLFNHLDHILWLRVRLRLLSSLQGRGCVRDPFSKTAPVCTIFLCSDLHLSNYYSF